MMKAAKYFDGFFSSARTLPADTTRGFDKAFTERVGEMATAQTQTAIAIRHDLRRRQGK